MSGADVKELQISVAGFTASHDVIVPDGSFGQKTQDALRRFQWSYGHVAPVSASLLGVPRHHSIPQLIGSTVVSMALREYLVEEVALDCAEGLLTRREALRRLSLLGVSTATATSLLAACGSDDKTSPSSVLGTAAATVQTTVVQSQATETSPATAEPVGTSAERISGEGEEIRFAGPHGELIGVLALAEAPLGSVLVIHENRGLTAHIRSLPPRLAADGYNALAIDLLSEEGGTASLGDEGAATAALGAASEERLIADLRAGLDELVSLKKA
jgi:carboxymethylenebutenolidase